MPQGLMRLLCGLLACTAATWAAAAETDELLATIKALGPRGEGHTEARAAVEELSRAEPRSLMTILAACDDANPLARNWIIGAFQVVADRTLKSGGRLPAAELEAFVRDRAHDPQVRRLAYEWLTRIDPSAPDRIIPEMLDDPSAEMRRDAVARLMDAAREFESTGETGRARETWERALSGAVDNDQVNAIVAALKKHGRSVDLIEHFGFVMDWHLVGPFDNAGMRGFDVPYPPEKQIDLAAAYEGRDGPVRWQRFTSQKRNGMFDINELTEPHKGAVAYATTTFVSDRRQDVQFRLSTQNAWKMWLNGRLLFEHEEYHRGKRFDQYRVTATLLPGENRILLKILQNEQDYDWSREWAFHFRVTDFSGRAVHEAPQPAGSTP